MPSFNRIVYTTNVYLQNLKQPGFPVQVTEKTGNLPIFDLSNFVIKNISFSIFIIPNKFYMHAHRVVS
jgi:hypothetical protein